MAEAEQNTSQQSQTQQPATAGASLPGYFALLGSSWHVYIKRFWTLIGISFVPLLAYLAVILASVIFGLIGGLASALTGTLTMIVFGLVFLVGIIAIVVVAIWSQVALLTAIDRAEETLGIKESFRRAWPKVNGYFWVGVLAGLVVVGGLFLLLVPGIIFYVWFVFSSMVVVFENEKGMNALLKSRELVRGCWWGIFGRLIFFAVILIGISIILEMLHLGVLANIVNFLLTPLSVAYVYLLYRSAKAARGEFAFSPSKSSRNIFTAIAVFGIIALVALLMAMAIGISDLSQSGVIDKLMNGASGI